MGVKTVRAFNQNKENSMLCTHTSDVEQPALNLNHKPTELK